MLSQLMFRANRNVVRSGRLAIAVVLGAALLLSVDAGAAEVGIKYNRPKSAYPTRVLRDFKMFHQDHINTVMIALPWAAWEPRRVRLDVRFIDNKLAPVLEYAANHNMTIVISNHSDYWGSKGNWSIPGWVRRTPGYTNATSTLIERPFRDLQVTFLEGLISDTSKFQSVIGYNILNEPVAATSFAVRKTNKIFQSRWYGIIAICQSIAKYTRTHHVSQFVTIGNGGDDAAYARFEWVDTGRYDLRPFWTQTLSMIGAQNIMVLRQATQWYPKAPMIRTEGYMSAAKRPAHGPFAMRGDQLSPSKYGVHKGNWETFFDYDSDYNYAGQANSVISNLRAFYVWRVGSPDGKDHIGLLNSVRGVPTPYYFALRDIAAGIDSIESYARSALPRSLHEVDRFKDRSAVPAVSVRWSGKGSIVAERSDVARGAESSMAARVELTTGQSVSRSVISRYWVDNGVTKEYGLTFLGKTASPGPQVVTLELQLANGSAVPVRVSIKGEAWHWYSVPLASLGVRSNGDITKIRYFRIANDTSENDRFLIDNILLRSAEWVSDARHSLSR